MKPTKLFEREQLAFTGVGTRRDGWFCGSNRDRDGIVRDSLGADGGISELILVCDDDRH